MKAIKPRERDWQRMLLSKDDASFVEELRHRVKDDDKAENVLVDLILRASAWRDIDVPMRAANGLVALGRLSVLVEVFLYICDKWDLDDLDLDLALGRIGLVIGDHGDSEVGDELLGVLDEALLADGALHPAWINLVEVVVHIAERRGTRDDRAWRWLERARAEDEPLWCSYAGGYGDPRAVPLLRSIVDRFDHNELLTRASFDDDQQVVTEAIAALQKLGASRTSDDELSAAIRRDARARSNAAQR